jgi:hypothetical protein
LPRVFRAPYFVTVATSVPCSRCVLRDGSPWYKHETSPRHWTSFSAHSSPFSRCWKRARNQKRRLWSSAVSFCEGRHHLREDVRTWRSERNSRDVLTSLCCNSQQHSPSALPISGPVSYLVPIFLCNHIGHSFDNFKHAERFLSPVHAILRYYCRLSVNQASIPKNTPWPLVRKRIHRLIDRHLLPNFSANFCW